MLSPPVGGGDRENPTAGHVIDRPRQGKPRQVHMRHSTSSPATRVLSGRPEGTCLCFLSLSPLSLSLSPAETPQDRPRHQPATPVTCASYTRHHRPPGFPPVDRRELASVFCLCLRSRCLCLRRRPPKAGACLRLLSLSPLLLSLSPRMNVPVVS